MRLVVSEPAAIPGLIAALASGDCVVARSAAATATTVDVVFPWVETAADAEQAAVELRFFARAWEAAHPGLRVDVAG